MTKRLMWLVALCLMAGLLAVADVYGRRSVTEKVTEAELIVHGVATLEGLPLEKTEHPVRRSCKIVVLATLWPTNEPATNFITVNHWAWAKWPDTWWNYNSQTGVYFFERTTTALSRARADLKRRDPQGLTRIPGKLLGTNVWTPLSRFDDWYEPATSIAIIQDLVQRSKK
jgi:hypothetical protein